MNKFAIYGILALAALAVSVSSAPTDETTLGDPTEEEEGMAQAISKTGDAKETERLESRGMKIFETFCIESRDNILSTLKDRSNALSSNVFNVFFKSVEAIGKEAINVQNVATEKLGSQLANPDAPITESADDEASKIIADGQAAVQNGPNQPNNLLNAFKTVFSALSKHVGNMIGAKFEELKKISTPENLALGLLGGCEEVSKIENDLRQSLETYKRDGMSDEMRDKFSSTELASIPCATISNIVRVKNFCDLVKVTKEPVKAILATQG